MSDLAGPSSGPAGGKHVQSGRCSGERLSPDCIKWELMRHHLLGVTLSGPWAQQTRQATKSKKYTGRQEENVGGKGCHLGDSPFITKPWPFSLSVYLQGNLSNSSSLTCIMHTCAHLSVCRGIILSMHEWACMCVSVCWHVCMYVLSCVHCELACMCSHISVFVCLHLRMCIISRTSCDSR